MIRTPVVRKRVLIAIAATTLLRRPTCRTQPWHPRDPPPAHGKTRRDHRRHIGRGQPSRGPRVRHHREHAAVAPTTTDGPRAPTRTTPAVCKWQGTCSLLRRRLGTTVSGTARDGGTRFSARRCGSGGLHEEHGRVRCSDGPPGTRFRAVLDDGGGSELRRLRPRQIRGLPSQPGNPVRPSQTAEAIPVLVFPGAFTGRPVAPRTLRCPAAPMDVDERPASGRRFRAPAEIGALVLRIWGS